MATRPQLSVAIPQTQADHQAEEAALDSYTPSAYLYSAHGPAFGIQLCSCPICVYVGAAEWASAAAHDDGHDDDGGDDGGEGPSEGYAIVRDAAAEVARNAADNGGGEWGYGDGSGEYVDDDDGWAVDELYISPTTEKAFSQALEWETSRSKASHPRGAGRKKREPKRRQNERYDENLGRVIHTKKTKIKASVYAKAEATRAAIVEQNERRKNNARLRLGLLISAAGLEPSFAAAAAAAADTPRYHAPSRPTRSRQQRHQRQQRQQPPQPVAASRHDYTRQLMEDLGVEERLARLLFELQTRDATPEDYELLLELDETVEARTLDAATVDVLPTLTVGSGPGEYDPVADADALCPVCMFEYEAGESVRQLPCGHAFHVECIDEWLRNHARTCPVDRTELDQ
ncbi:uncharacterized protein AMSG_10298 [Thecamonas trahens ATCC 50062]|uniref:RING-type domain-containing protein n=1 Tax=Thecamonas trahens ATCC 50062 TaxID=461836 RepID=A0A0L0DPT2_THETB|nr:hypothetical protein AMSG_10298 [Thecamonas trahens ATCC 50062]KNC54314.1 hypothetical protein AMSG_10298 [Thecamonas trahens ATCC 50062]|eukprot:XP_013753775.1 hypothetical protein AMSG_10298 [Thecamonas trahens ATCC 50062]